MAQEVLLKGACSLRPNTGGRTHPPIGVALALDPLAFAGGEPAPG